jgi:hypothetical protein
MVSSGLYRASAGSGQVRPKVALSQVKRQECLIRSSGQGQDRTVDLPLFSPAVVAVSDYGFWRGSRLAAGHGARLGPPEEEPGHSPLMPHRPLVPHQAIRLATLVSCAPGTNDDILTPRHKSRETGRWRMPDNPSADVATGIQGADFTDRRNNTGADSFAHAPARRVCKNCDRPIEARQPARRKGADDWVHDICPVTD